VTDFERIPEVAFDQGVLYGLDHSVLQTRAQSTTILLGPTAVDAEIGSGRTAPTTSNSPQDPVL
jgi:hypothetical protein